jgi:hypothetical protein
MSERNQTYNITSLPKQPGNTAVDAELFRHRGKRQARREQPRQGNTASDWGEATLHTAKKAAEKLPNYKLRRLVVGAAITSLAVTGAFEGGKALFGHDKVSAVDTSHPHREYTVKPGDTIFDISTRALGNQDPTHLEDEIAATLELEHKDPNVIYPGEKIELPEGALIGSKVPGQPQPADNNK